MKSSTLKNRWILLPVWCMLVFIILYIVSASLYPGGTDADKTAKGFSWQHNYWCELLAKEAQNGQPNTARPVAIVAMTILAISLVIFWYTIPPLFTNNRIVNRIITCTGTGSMLVMPLLLTKTHDLVINSAAFLGCIAIIGLLVNLLRLRLYFLFYLGIFCLLLCGLNNYVYYSNDFLMYLPVIQKISFVFFLLWFMLVSIKGYKKNETRKVNAIFPLQ